VLRVSYRFVGLRPMSCRLCFRLPPFACSGVGHDVQLAIVVAGIFSLFLLKYVNMFVYNRSGPPRVNQYSTRKNRVMQILGPTKVFSCYEHCPVNFKGYQRVSRKRVLDGELWLQRRGGWVATRWVGYYG
jgi:hypothetical protein